MKKRSFLSILLVFVMIAAVCLFVGCDEEETNAKIDNAVVEAVNQATEKIDAAKAALETAIAAKADTATLTTKIEELNAAIDAAKAAATTADAALKTELTAAIAAAQTAATDAAAANLAAAKTELTTAIAAKADTETVNTKVTELTAAIEAAKKAATDADAALKTEIEAAIAAATKAATDNLAAVKAELEAALATNAAEAAKKVTELTTAIEAAKTAATAADATLKAELEAAIADATKTAADAYVAIKDWNETTEYVIDLLVALDKKYDSLSDTVKAVTATVKAETVIRLYRAIDNASAKAAYDFAEKLFAAVEEIDKVTYTKEYYYADEQAAIDALIAKAAKDVLELAYGEDASELVADLKADIADVDTKAEIILATLTANGTTADIIVSEEWFYAITDVAGKLDVETALAEDTDSGIPAVITAYTAYAKRYEEVFTAKEEAAAINAAIVAHTNKLNGKYSVITSDFVTEFDAIVEDVADWKETYFTDYAKEGANWAMLNHDAFAALEVLFEEKIGVLITLAEAANVAIAKLGTITIKSGIEIEEAKAAYLAFTNKLGDLEFEIGNVPTSGELAMAVTKANADFIKICKDAIAAYETLEEIDTTTVTIYDGEAVAAIVAWFNKYFGVDVTAANSTLGIETLTITDGATELTFTEDDLTAAKALKAAYETLAAAKVAETEAVEKAIAALKATLSNREAADAAQAARKAWVNGTNAPEGFTAAQFAIDETNDTYVISNYSELKAIRNAIKALETRYAELTTKPANLTKVEMDLVDATVRAEYAAYVAMVEADIAKFVEDNLGEDPFTTEQYAMIETAKVEIAQGAAIQEVKDATYATILETLKGIEDERVVTLLTNRADAALAKAIATIKEVISTKAEDFATNGDELALILFTAEEYIKFYADYNYAADELFVALELLSNRVADGLRADLTTEKNFVSATFTKAVSDSLIVYPDGTLPDIDFGELQ